MRLKKHGLQPIPRRSINLVVTVWILVCFSFVGSTVIDQIESQRVRFNSASEDYRQELNQEFLATTWALKSFSSLFVTSGYTAPERVTSYVDDIVKEQPSIFALEVMQRVKHANLDSFIEKKKQTDSDFRIKTFDYTERRWKSGLDTFVHYPIIFAEPQPPVNKDVIGLDIANIPFLAPVIEKAYKTKTTVWTHPFKLVEGYLGFLIFTPIPNYPDLIVSIVINADAIKRPERLLLASNNRGIQVKVSNLAWSHHESGGKIIDMSTKKTSALEKRLLPSFRYTNTLKSYEMISVELERQVTWHDLRLDILALTLIMTGISSWGLYKYLRNYHLRWMANHDALTNLPNRMLMMDRLEQALLSSQRSGEYGAVLFIDMNKFKQLNDNHGHHHGDLLLIEVAQRLKSMFREADTVARQGGDEFMVIMSEIGVMREDAERNLEQLKNILNEKLSKPYQLEDLLYQCSASIGSTLFHGNALSPDEVMATADKAMYEVKYNRLEQ